MSKFSIVWVFSDVAEKLPELITAARDFSDNISVISSNSTQSELAFRLGANSVYEFEKIPEDIILEDCSETLTNIIVDKSAGDKTLVLLPATRRAKTIAARISGGLKAGLVNETSSLRMEGESIIATRMVYGGLALGEEEILTNNVVITLSNGSFSPAIEDPSLVGCPIKLEFIKPKNSISCISRRPKQGENVDLSKAKFVVSVGRGIGSKENISTAQELCDLINAELACSRVIAENEKWMERERYVGISGIMIKPELYMALGISGQIQHMVGANGSQRIVAVNKDKNAPIFKYVDYGIVGDLMKVVPALITKLKN